MGFGKSRGRGRSSSSPPPATDRQKELIDELDLGYTKPALDALTMADASAIIDEELERRREAGESWDGWSIPKGGS
jgi:hypothetical protein